MNVLKSPRADSASHTIGNEPILAASSAQGRDEERCDERPDAVTLGMSYGNTTDSTFRYVRSRKGFQFALAQV